MAQKNVVENEEGKSKHEIKGVSAEPKKLTFEEEIKKTESVINEKLKEYRDEEQDKKNELMHEVYCEEIKNLSAVELTRESILPLVEKVKELKIALWTIETKGKTEEEVKEMKSKLRTERNLWDTFTCPITKHPRVFFDFHIPDIVNDTNMSFMTGMEGQMSIREVFETMNITGYSHTLFKKAGIEMTEKQPRGLKSIKKMSAENLVKQMTPEQKEALMKILAA